MHEEQSLKQEPEKGILIFESDDELGISLSRLLSREKFDVFLATNIEQAKMLLDQEIIGCVIFGLNQPFNKSLDHLKAIACHEQRSNILILSSFDWIEVQNEVSEIKIKHFMTKPVKQEQLIKQIIERKRSSV